MSRGGAARQRAGKEPAAPSSGRVTAPPPKAKDRRRINWVVAVMVTLVLVGLVGGYFVALMGTSNDTTTTSTTLAP